MDEQVTTSALDPPVTRESLGRPNRGLIYIALALAAGGIVPALLAAEEGGALGWVIAAGIWLAAIVCLILQPSREKLVERRLNPGEEALSDAHGARHFRVGWLRDRQQGSCVLGSLEAAGRAAGRLAAEKEAHGEIYCFESVVWPDIGNIPRAQYKWDRAAGRWQKIETIDHEAAVAAVERKREEEERMAAMAAASND